MARLQASECKMPSNNLDDVKTGKADCYILYHSTSEEAVEGILRQGLKGRGSVSTLTNSSDESALFGGRQTGFDYGKVRVIEFYVPREEVDKRLSNPYGKPGEYGSNWHGIRGGKLPRDWIHTVYRTNKNYQLLPA